MNQKEKIRLLDFSFEQTLTFIIFALFVAIVPTFVHQQWFTGPFVNALLILTVVLIGSMEGVLLGLFPSVLALTSGLLPVALAPMIPFIMISNAIFVAVFAYLNKKNFSLGIVVAAFLKYLFLFFISTFLAQNLLPETLLPKVAGMMSWVQFATALIGGVFAFVVLKFLKKGHPYGK